MESYRKDYPRPQFVRSDWENLNGIWDFAFDDQNTGEHQKWYEHFPKEREIRVPFTFETVKSGIHEESRHDHIWYQRTIQADGEKLKNFDYLLHFEGSDFITKLWVNGQYAGSHKGGYTRFSFHITELLHDGENILTVKVEDSFDTQQPRGKQRWLDESYLCWYVPTTGIWKTVWSEYVPKVSLSEVKMTPNLSEGCLELECRVQVPENRFSGELLLETCITYEGEMINRTFTAVLENHFRMKLDVSKRSEKTYVSPVHVWTPQDPCLYDIEFRLVEKGTVLDEVGSYFAMREIRVEGSKILLNGRLLYQKLILDQGYWEESHLTPPDEEALIEDIDKIRAMGYNGLRKHQKTEDERFFYWCDVKGMLVWCEAPSAYEFTDDAVTEFTSEWLEIVKQYYNHPSIITWTPVNESWGMTEIHTRRDQQHFTEAIYHLTKSIDSMRPVIVNDGWEHTVSDILTLHDYEPSASRLKERYLNYRQEILSGQVNFSGMLAAFAEGYAYKGQPVILSEFGGIALDNGASGWGYGDKANGEEEFLERFEDLVTAVMELPYVCGYCYTQVTDVQQEINGLLDKEHHFKVDPEKIRQINEKKVNCLFR